MTAPIVEEFSPIMEKMEELKNHGNVLDCFIDHLSKTVVRDDNVKKLCFLAGISAYSEEPLNIFLRGPSSIGKTYNPEQALKYFPRRDVWFLAGLSPKALIHDKGLLIDEEGQEVDLRRRPDKRDFKDSAGKRDNEAYKLAMQAWDERLRNSHYEVDLHNKILFFLEAPNLETFMMLRPLLSHDTSEYEYRFTDKTGSGKLVTTLVVIKGWPATIFCSTDMKYVEDLATRGFTVTPEMSEAKYREAIRLHAKRECDPLVKSLLFKELVDLELRTLQSYVEDVISHRAKITVNRYTIPVLVPYAEKLSEAYPAKLSRDMRDWKQFMNLIKVNCMLNLRSRPILGIRNEKGYEEFVLATAQDLMVAYQIFRSMEETTRTGISGHTLQFFHDTVEPYCTKYANVHYADLTSEYNETHDRKVSSKTISRWCSLLEDIGYMDKQPDPDDKRYVVLNIVKKKNVDILDISKLNPFFSFDSFKEWFNTLKNNGHNFTFYIKKKIKGEELNDLEKISSISESIFRPYFSFDFQLFKQNSTPKQSINLEREELSTSIKGSHFEHENPWGNSKPKTTVKKGPIDLTSEESETLKKRLRRPRKPVPKAPFSFDEVVGCHEVPSAWKGECDFCSKKNVTVRFQVDLFSKGVFCVCQDCGGGINRYLREKENQ